VEVTADERRDQATYFATLLAAQQGTRSGTFDIPRVKPAYRQIRLAPDGRVWIQASMPSQRYAPAASPSGSGPVVAQLGWREPTTYDVFEVDGGYLGRVDVPLNVSVHAMRGDHVWANVVDEDGVAAVQRYRIVW
jgi:hypothetical protein